MVTGAGHVAVAADGTVLVSWPPEVVAGMGALVGAGRNATKRNGGLSREVEAALVEFARAVHASRQASRGNVTADRHVRDSGGAARASFASSPTVTVQEAAAMLNQSESTVLRHKSRYGAEMVGRQWHLSRVLVDADVRRSA